MVIVWRLRGNIIRTALCWIVWHNVHNQQHTYVSSSYRSNRLGLSHWDPYAVRRGGCLELCYYNMVEWFWWESDLILTTNCIPSVLWHCWFGHLACKNHPHNDHINWSKCVCVCVWMLTKVEHTLSHSCYYHLLMGLGNAFSHVCLCVSVCVCVCVCVYVCLTICVSVCLVRAVMFESLDLETSFLVRRNIFRMSRPNSCISFMGSTWLISVWYVSELPWSDQN